MTDLQNVFYVLNNAFPESEIKVNGLTELTEHFRPKGRSGNHLKIHITSQLFAGNALLEQHIMVHNALSGLMQMNGGFIHAVTIKTKVSE